jgi:hypothetical protein
MFKWLRQLKNEKTCSSPEVPGSRFGPRNAWGSRQRQHKLSTLIDSLSPVAQELMKGWLETQEYKKELERHGVEAVARDTELTKVLTEIYHINLEEFRTLLEFEENL